MSESDTPLLQKSTVLTSEVLYVLLDPVEGGDLVQDAQVAGDAARAAAVHIEEAWNNTIKSWEHKHGVQNFRYFSMHIYWADTNHE